MRMRGHNFEDFNSFLIQNAKPRNSKAKSVTNSTINSYMAKLKPLIKKAQKNKVDLHYKKQKTYTTKVF